MPYAGNAVEVIHNGAFHLIQMVGLVCLLIGLRTDLVSRRGAERA
jgi:hypothetical protein